MRFAFSARLNQIYHQAFWPVVRLIVTLSIIFSTPTPATQAAPLDLPVLHPAGETQAQAETPTPTPSSTPTDTSSLTNGLVAYWKMDEASGTRIDATGRGNDLADNNGVGQTTGKISNAAQFTVANNKYLSHPDNSDLSTGDIDFTIAGWVYLDNLGTVSFNPTIFAKWINTPEEYEYGLEYNHTSQRLRFYISGNGTSATTIDANGFGPIATGQWYFFVTWHDAVNNKVGISLNNVSDTIDYSGGGYNSSNPFVLGATNKGTSNYRDGRIDEVGFWKRLLTADERAALYNG